MFRKLNFLNLDELENDQNTKSILVPEIIIDLVFELALLRVRQGRVLEFAPLCDDWLTRPVVIT